MNTTGWIILIVVVVLVVIAIVIVASTVGRRRKLEADRNRAAELREDAARDELAAREREAKSARAAADAKQAEVEAERLRREAAEREQAAAEARTEQEKKLSHADSVDPDVETDRHGNRVETDRNDLPPRRADAPAHSAPRIDGVTGEERRPEDRQP
jgi:FtsZ-interacting cell division protein ZipA